MGDGPIDVGHLTHRQYDPRIHGCVPIPSRQEVQGSGVPRPDDAEVSAIGRCHIDDSETLRCRNDGRIDCTEAKVFVAVHQLGDAQPVGGHDWLGKEVPSR